MRKDMNRIPNIHDKEKSRRIFATAVRDGVITKKPCEKCGEQKVHGHHTDYSKPLDVMWLCQKHHKEWHKVHGFFENTGTERKAITITRLKQLAANYIVEKGIDERGAKAVYDFLNFVEAELKKPTLS